MFTHISWVFIVLLPCPNAHMHRFLVPILSVARRGW